MNSIRTGEEENFAVDMIADEALKLGCKLTRDEVRGGLISIMSLAETPETQNGRPRRTLRTSAEDIHFFAGEHGWGVELGGRWRLEYRPGKTPDSHKVVIMEGLSGGKWVVQDTPGGAAGKVFFQLGAGGGVHISRQVHFFRGKLWDPVAGVPADTGYDEDGGITFSRSFRDGMPNDESSTRPLRGTTGRVRRPEYSTKNKGTSGRVA